MFQKGSCWFERYLGGRWGGCLPPPRRIQKCVWVHASWGSFLSPLCLFHLPLCFGAGEWVFVHNVKFHFVFWEIWRTNNIFKVSVWSSKSFPGQKVLSICFLRPSKLYIMEDASAFKDLVVCSLMLPAISLSPCFASPEFSAKPVVLQRAVGRASFFSWTELLVKPRVNSSPVVVVTCFSLYREGLLWLF